jgi:transposase
LIVGADVAKAELVVGCPGHSEVRHIANRAQEIDAWLSELPAGSIVAMESTGVYHRLLATRAHAAGMRVYVLNARDVHFYAKAMGTRGKTDRVDAGVIARYVAEHHARLRPWRPTEPAHGRIEELVRRRGVLVTKRDAIRQTLRGCADLAASLALLERTFDDLLGALDAKVQSLIDADAALIAGQRRVASVIGFGPQGSSMLAVLLARLDFANADALVAYSGLDPRPHDSGNKRGKRRITKRGPAYLRRQVYMAGFSASHSKALKPLYQALRAKGFATTEAFMILGRKLLRAAYAVWKTGQPFEPSKLMPKIA